MHFSTYKYFLGLFSLVLVSLLTVNAAPSPSFALTPRMESNLVNSTTFDLSSLERRTGCKCPGEEDKKPHSSSKGDKDESKGGDKSGKGSGSGSTSSGSNSASSSSSSSSPSSSSSFSSSTSSSTSLSFKGILEAGSCHTTHGFATALGDVFDQAHRQLSASLAFLASEEVKTCSSAKLSAKLEHVKEVCGHLQVAIEWLVSQGIAFEAETIFGIEGELKSSLSLLLSQFESAFFNLEASLSAHLLAELKASILAINTVLGKITSDLSGCLKGSVSGVFKSRFEGLAGAMAKLCGKLGFSVGGAAGGILEAGASLGGGLLGVLSGALGGGFQVGGGVEVGGGAGFGISI